MKIKNPFGFAIGIAFLLTSIYSITTKDWRMAVFYIASGVINIVITI